MLLSAKPTPLSPARWTPCSASAEPANCSNESVAVRRWTSCSDVGRRREICAGHRFRQRDPPRPAAVAQGQSGRVAFDSGGLRRPWPPQPSPGRAEVACDDRPCSGCPRSSFPAGAARAASHKVDYRGPAAAAFFGGGPKPAGRAYVSLPAGAADNRAYVDAACPLESRRRPPTWRVGRRSSPALPGAAAIAAVSCPKRRGKADGRSPARSRRAVKRNAGRSPARTGEPSVTVFVCSPF